MTSRPASARALAAIHQDEEWPVSPSQTDSACSPGQFVPRGSDTDENWRNPRHPFRCKNTPEHLAVDLVLKYRDGRPPSETMKATFCLRAGAQRRRNIPRLRQVQSWLAVTEGK